MYINAWASNTMFKHRINTTQTKFKLNKNAQIKKKKNVGDVRDEKRIERNNYFFKSCQVHYFGHILSNPYLREMSKADVHEVDKERSGKTAFRIERHLSVCTAT